VSAALAARVLGLIDLTRLERPDEPGPIDALAAKAATPAGRVAALCVYPEWVARVRDAGVPVAAVANFPAGRDDPAPAAREAAEAVAAGAAEIDVVVPWRAFLAGDETAIWRTLAAVRAEVGAGVRVKAILETGSLDDAEAIRAAGSQALAAGADFLKTSTGKVGPGASPYAVQALLEVVLAVGRGGVKASGGIRTVAQAAEYLALADSMMGPGWVAPDRFRFGASGLADDVLARLA
jgi:deoxyribose-phosphate aldolase